MSTAKKKDMVSGKTTTGFEFELPSGILDDFELLEKLNELDDNNAQLPAFLRGFLGEEQYKAMKEHCRRGGVVSTAAMGQELINIFSAVNALKK